MGTLTDIMNSQLDGWVDSGIERFPRRPRLQEAKPDDEQADN